MRDRIGWYVHHHGAGHASRAAAVVAEMTGPVSLLSELPLVAPRSGVEAVLVPPDDDGASAAADPTASGALHWAPLQPALLGPRTRRLVEWLTGGDVAGLVCDVSVEAAILARLCGTRTVIVRMHGRRDDAPHGLAAAVADAFLAPYPEALEEPSTPPEVRARTFYAGFTTPPRPVPSRSEARRRLGLPAGRLVLVAVGGGGHRLSAADLRGLGAELAGTQVVVVGPVDEPSTPGRAPGHVRVEGWVSDMASYLAAADVVIGSAGMALVGEVVSADRPFVVVPEPRPFGEQRSLAERLEAVGAAVVAPGWAERPRWGELIEAALALDPGAGAALAGPPPRGGARITARWLEATFRRSASVAVPA